MEALRRALGRLHGEARRVRYAGERFQGARRHFARAERFCPRERIRTALKENDGRGAVIPKALDGVGAVGLAGAN